MTNFRHLFRLVLLTSIVVTGVVGMSFVKAPKLTLKEIALQKQNENKIIPVYMHPVNVMFNGRGADAAMLCNAGGSGKPIKDQFGTDYIVTTYFDEALNESYFSMAEAIANQLNEGLGTTAFKAVYAKDLPMKTVKFLGREDEVVDWWQTEYDLVVNLAVVPIYITKSSGAAHSTDFEFSATMSVNTVEPGKQALGYMGTPNNLNTLKTDAVSHENCFNSLDELKENVSQPDVFAPTCFDGNKDAVAKFIEKENKKYDKANKKK